jgi:hypothetical protein
VLRLQEGNSRTLQNGCTFGRAFEAVEVKELTAFLTGARLSPSAAYVLKGSDVNMCARTQELLDADKQTANLHYDRCAPSLLAFGEKREAIEFSRQHGGVVLSFPEAAASFGQSEAPTLH